MPDNTLPWGVQNGLTDRFVVWDVECGLGLAEGSTSSIAFARWRQCALVYSIYKEASASGDFRPQALYQGSVPEPRCGAAGLPSRKLPILSPNSGHRSTPMKIQQIKGLTWTTLNAWHGSLAVG